MGPIPTLIVIVLVSWLWLRFCRKRPRVMQATGIFASIAGLILVFWSRAHSPYMGLGEMMTKPNTFILKEGAYYILLMTSAGLILGGVFLFIKGFVGLNPNFAKALSGAKGSRLDELRKAKELLDSGAIDADEFERIKKTELES